MWVRLGGGLGLLSWRVLQTHLPLHWGWEECAGEKDGDLQAQGGRGPPGPDLQVKERSKEAAGAMPGGDHSPTGAKEGHAVSFGDLSPGCRGALEPWGRRNKVYCKLAD